MRVYIFLFTCLFALVGCTRFDAEPQPEERPPAGLPVSRYGEVKLGQKLRFRVTETRFYANDDSTQDSWFRTEVCDSVFHDPEGFLWGRYRIDSSQTDSSRVFMGRIYRLWDDDRLLEQEGLNYTLRMTRPLTLEARWSPRSHNYAPAPPWGDDRFTCEALDAIWTVGGLRYDSCVLILERKVVNSINYDILTRSVYAPELGLVHRYDRYKVFQVSTQPDGSLKSEIVPAVSYVREWVREY